MAIDDNIDASAPDAEKLSEQETTKDAPELSAESTEDAAKDRAALLHKGLNDKAAELKKAKAEIARLRSLAGEEEVIPAPKKEETEFVTKKELWLQANQPRIDIVKEEYEKIVEEGYEGEKVSEKIALELAEKQAKIDNSATNRRRADDMTVATVTIRNSSAPVYLSETDKALGMTEKKKRELEKRHPHLLDI